MPITAETRQLIFEKLVKNLEKLAPPMVVKADPAQQTYELTGNKPVPYGYDKKIIPGMYFASIAQRKDSVAFYFFPSYADTNFIEVAPTLYKCLKGKTCFHFKKDEEVNEQELHMLLETGMKAWKDAGYVD